MAKRVRGQRSTHRPGGVGPARLDREPATTRRTPTSSGVRASTATIGESAVVASPSRSALVATPAARPTIATRGLHARTRLRSGGLEQKASAEAGWVTEDLRRIAVISAIMLAGLALAWVLFVLLGIGGFY